ncbi:MAG: hypothetical protein ACI4MU_11080 [Candidatus Ventricola sp.]
MEEALLDQRHYMEHILRYGVDHCGVNRTFLCHMDAPDMHNLLLLPAFAGGVSSKREHFTRFMGVSQGEILMFSQYFCISAKTQKNAVIFRVIR